MKFKDINNLVYHKELTTSDLPKGYEVLEEEEDGTSLTIVNRVQYITKQYGLEYILNKNNTITKADVFKLAKAYQLQFPIQDNHTTTKLYIIQRRYIQITDPRNGNEYEKFDYILTEMEEINDLDNTLYFYNFVACKKFLDDFGIHYQHILGTFFDSHTEKI